MAAKSSPLLSRLAAFCSLFIPPLLILVGLVSFYQFNTTLVGSWLINLTWISPLSLVIAGIIAWQFGRSRLVYACLLLALFLEQPWLVMAPAWEDARFCGMLFSFVYLLYSKDKGFSFINLLLSLSVFTGLFFIAWFMVPPLSVMIQPWITSLTSLLFQFSPQLLTISTPFYLSLLLVIFVFCLARLLFRLDNSHNALFFALLVAITIHLHPNSEFSTLGILALSVLICYSVIKDSFNMAFKDELTGIPSRRALMQYVQTMGRKYTVVMSDIDHFKKFNDTYGHDVGDEVLKLVASKLNNICGGGKTFRFGGEEFIMLFPRKTADEVLPFVEIVRQTIADYDIALRAKPRPAKPKKAPPKKPAKDKIVKVTSSFGIAQRNKQHSEFADIMKQADIALYAAKKAGRNCVKVAKQ